MCRLPAVPDAGLEAFVGAPLTFPPFLWWKVAAPLARLSEFLAAPADAGIATVTRLRLSRRENGYANCE
ncbi:MAG: hypothetical protein DMF60_03475 [Acidobacteria bacterium]|nr:MAG: hypothetical protein DMF60_03475 [Acidobacteriota bacterium]